MEQIVWDYAASFDEGRKLVRPVIWQLAQCFRDYNGVFKVEKELPYNLMWHKVEREFEAYCAGQNDMTDAGYTSAIEELEIPE